jgi:hypothetical protein
MTKRTMTPEEHEWAATQEARWQWILRRLNAEWRETGSGDVPRRSSPLRRRLFPWRIHVERLS